MHWASRKENESYEDYRKRLKLSQEVLKEQSKGVVFFQPIEQMVDKNGKPCYRTGQYINSKPVKGKNPNTPTDRKEQRKGR